MMKFSGIIITHAKAGLDETTTPFSNLSTKRVEFQFSQEDIPNIRRDIKQLIVNLHQLKIDNELAKNLGPQFDQVMIEEEAKKGVPTGEISYNKCYIYAAK